MKIVFSLVTGFVISCGGMVTLATPAAATPPTCDPADINCVYVPYTCNYDVLCDAAGNVIPGPMSGVRLGNGQICAGERMHPSMTANPKMAMMRSVIVVGTVGLGAFATVTSAHAEPTIIPGITVLTIVRWHGTDCIPARTADGERSLCNTVGQPRSDSIVEHGKAVGDLVGVDPVMGDAAWVSCEMFLNGSPTMSDSALAGDGSDATCLKVLQ